VNKVIRIRPHHDPKVGAVLPDYARQYLVTCSCGWRDKAGSAPTNAGRKREATLLAMNHNTSQHGYTYEIQGGSS
jgi:hypothetical protein